MTVAVDRGKGSRRAKRLAYCGMSTVVAENNFDGRYGG